MPDSYSDFFPGHRHRTKRSTFQRISLGLPTLLTTSLWWHFLALYDNRKVSRVVPWIFQTLCSLCTLSGAPTWVVPDLFFCPVSSVWMRLDWAPFRFLIVSLNCVPLKNIPYILKLVVIVPSSQTFAFYSDPVVFGVNLVVQIDFAITDVSKLGVPKFAP